MAIDCGGNYAYGAGQSLATLNGNTFSLFTLLCAPPLAEARQDTNEPFKILVTDDLTGL